MSISQADSSHSTSVKHSGVCISVNSELGCSVPSLYMYYCRYFQTLYGCVLYDIFKWFCCDFLCSNVTTKKRPVLQFKLVLTLKYKYYWQYCKFIYRWQFSGIDAISSIAHIKRWSFSLLHFLSEGRMYVGYTVAWP